MEAQQLIRGASFGPDTVKAIGQAFDLAWTEIEQTHSATEFAKNSARIKLAQAVLSVAREDSRDVNLLREQALKVLATR